MPKTIDESGRPVLIEAVYYRHFSIYSEKCDSIEEATSFLTGAADDGWCAPVGVYVNGKPRKVSYYDRSPTLSEYDNMLENYRRLIKKART